MLRHHHISDHHKFVALAHLFQNFHKYIFAIRNSEQRLATIAARGDEMQIATAIEALETFGHSGIVQWDLWNVCDG
jgi:hypothetical protein